MKTQDTNTNKIIDLTEPWLKNERTPPTTRSSLLTILNTLAQNAFALALDDPENKMDTQHKISLIDQAKALNKIIQETRMETPATQNLTALFESVRKLSPHVPESKQAFVLESIEVVSKRVENENTFQNQPT